ncbi:group II intron maturase-specific domain-containing protein [Trichococcus shcherbakoviae]|uniref:group II intron maturase-specific domain-containing protein n=1 Tax=Trichococcus shcherbakoviae TaxID=2094020 RepID=UPI0029F48864|nr:group II intron maturase-specific domain-containing protein [Trichococcus shcherbakoviae]
MENDGKVRSRPHKTAKQKFRKRLKQLTSRKRPGTFQDIVKEINQYTQGWINYYGIGDMKNFIRETAQWLNHRLRQLIWKRWKRVSTRFYGLMRYGLSTLFRTKIIRCQK